MNSYHSGDILESSSWFSLTCILFRVEISLVKSCVKKYNVDIWYLEKDFQMMFEFKSVISMSKIVFEDEKSNLN